MKCFCRWVPKKARRKGSSDKTTFQGKDYLRSADSRPEMAIGRRDQSHASIISHQELDCMLKKKIVLARSAWISSHIKEGGKCPRSYRKRCVGSYTCQEGLWSLKEHPQ